MVQRRLLAAFGRSQGFGRLRMAKKPEIMHFCSWNLENQRESQRGHLRGFVQQSRRRLACTRCDDHRWHVPGKQCTPLRCHCREFRRFVSNPRIWSTVPRGTRPELRFQGLLTARHNSSKLWVHSLRTRLREFLDFELTAVFRLLQ